MTAVAVPLELEEGVPLGYALVARLAADAGIRTLAIKGPASVGFGLRDPEHQSLDVDILVEPPRFADLIGLLEGQGWVPPQLRGLGHLLPAHSQPMAHPAWPMELDIHRRFPGFLGPDEHVFERLWATRTDVRIAGCAQPGPSRPAAVAVAALHLLRAGSATEEQLATLVRRVEGNLSAAERRELADLAVETDAVQTLGPVLERLGVEVDESSAAPPGLDAWRFARDAHGVRAVGWLVRLRSLPLRRWPKTIWRALWLSEEELRVRYPTAPPGLRGWVGMVVERWFEGLRALPRAMRLLRDHSHRS